MKAAIPIRVSQSHAKDRSISPGSSLVSEMRPTNRLRVGLVVDSLTQPRWIWNIVNDIQRSSNSEIVAVVLDPSGTESSAIIGKSLQTNRTHLLYSLYAKADALFFPMEQDPLAPENLSPLVSLCSRIRLATPIDKPISNRELRQILGQNLDVALHFGARTLEGKALTIAKHGVWAYHGNDDSPLANGPVGFWEVIERRPLTGSALYILSSDRNGDRIIYRSSTRTHPLSMRRNQSNALWKASAFVPRKLRDLYEVGPSALKEEIHNVSNRSNRKKALRGFPTNFEMLCGILGLLKRHLGSRFRRLVATEQWFLAYHVQGLVNTANPLSDPRRIKSIMPPADRFWADPFVVRKKGGYYVFFEECLFARRRGFLSVLEIDDSGNAGSPTKVLERDYHLSYPFVFHWNDQYFLVPESAANKTVELYRAVEFPYKWEFDRVLLRDVNAVDATLHCFDGRWWMFVNIALPGTSSCDELHIYYADTPLGPWLPHRRNPIKSDAGNARSAGRIFTRDGQFFRPAQDCSTRYGGSIIVNRMVRLDLEHYEEIEVSRILPDWEPNLVATHTFNAVDRLTVLDAKRLRSRWRRTAKAFC
ncbi:MAG: glucosamine inositolphosphorylceramide transferase family protein [Gemmatimonadaceae bacterium]